MTSSDVLFFPQPQYIQLAVREECRNNETLTSEKLKSERLDIFSLEMT